MTTEHQQRERSAPRRCAAPREAAPYQTRGPIGSSRGPELGSAGHVELSDSSHSMSTIGTFTSEKATPTPC